MLKFRLAVGVGLATVMVGLGLAATTNPAQAASYQPCNSTMYYRNTSLDTWLYWPIFDENLNDGDNFGEIFCTMRYGAEGIEVKALQTTLNHCYGATLDVDGEFGPNTKSALIAAQKAQRTNRHSDYVAGVYSYHEAWEFKKWGWYLASNGNRRWRCAFP